MRITAGYIMMLVLMLHLGTYIYIYEDGTGEEV